MPFNESSCSDEILNMRLTTYVLMILKFPIILGILLIAIYSFACHSVQHSSAQTGLNF